MVKDKFSFLNTLEVVDSDHSPYLDSNIVVSWYRDGASYYYWRQDPRYIYKNPGVGQAYFGTRRLDACKLSNAATMAEAERRIKDGDLIAKAIEVAVARRSVNKVKTRKVPA